MKKIKLFALSIGVAIAACVFNSCDDDGYSLGDRWYSIATVNPLDSTSRSFYLTLDNGTTLWPAASHAHWYKPHENQRAIVVYTILSDEMEGYDHFVQIHDIRDVLTKPFAEDLGEGNDEKYGTDPAKILDMWIGDGYLNVEFGFNYGGAAVHFINLMKNDDAETPYSFEFRHNAYNDSQHYGRRGYVAFDLSELDTNGESVTLNIKVKTFEGEKVYTIEYDPSSKNQSNRQKSVSEDWVDVK
ncbi:MAG: NigD-like protein [Tannerella sp.]|jgi:hypothetical protein|nr:NigD-like protein [Tannerella sp.]